MKRIIFMFESAVLWKGITFIEEKSMISLYPTNGKSLKLAELNEDTEYINIYTETVKELKRLDTYTDDIKNTLEHMEFRSFKTGKAIILPGRPCYDKIDIIKAFVSSILRNIIEMIAFNYIINNVTAKNVIKYSIVNGNYIDIIYDWHNAKYTQEFPKGFKLSNEIQSTLYRLMNRNEVSVDLRDKYYIRFIDNINSEEFFEYPISDNWEDTIL